MNGKAVIPYSGGIESMALVRCAVERMGYQPLPLVFIDNKTEAINRRSAIIAGLLKYGLYDDTRFLTMPNNDLLQSKSGYIPGYKLMMAVTALAYAQSRGADVVLFGHSAENRVQTYPDQTQEFFDEVLALFKRYYASTGSTLSIENPFREMTKAQVIATYAKSAPFELSVSCDSLTLSGLDHCGTCEGCTCRQDAFKLAGAKDPTDYRREPLTASVPH